MRKLILVSSVIGGVIAAFGGLMMGALLALFAVLGQSGGRANTLQAVTIALAVGTLGTGYGLALVWAGWTALRGKPGCRLTLPRWGWWLLALAVVLIVGQVAFSTGAKWLMPVLHVIAGALPAFLFLSLVIGSARSRGGFLAARPAAGSMAWGGLGGGGLGLFAEAIILVAAILGIVIWLGATQPELVERLQAWAQEAQRTGNFQDLGELRPLLTSLPLVLGILGSMGLLVPFIEELAKGLAVPLVAGTGRKLTRLDGFLLGTAAGAGFTLLEGVLNGALALSAPMAWAALMLVRGGTAAIHCCASGLVGLGWQALLVERRWARGIGLGILAVAMHGAWNVLAGAQTLLALRGSGETGMAEAVRVSLVTLPITALMGLVWLACVLGLALIPRRLVPVPASPQPAIDVASGQQSDVPLEEQ